MATVPGTFTCIRDSAHWSTVVQRAILILIVAVGSVCRHRIRYLNSSKFNLMALQSYKFSMFMLVSLFPLFFRSVLLVHVNFARDSLRWIKVSWWRKPSLQLEDSWCFKQISDCEPLNNSNRSKEQSTNKSIFDHRISRANETLG